MSDFWYKYRVLNDEFGEVDELTDLDKLDDFHVQVDRLIEELEEERNTTQWRIDDLEDELRETEDEIEEFSHMLWDIENRVRVIEEME